MPAFPGRAAARKKGRNTQDHATRVRAVCPPKGKPAGGAHYGGEERTELKLDRK